jgi:hypothetical protein
MRPFYITAKLNLYPLKDEIFNLPINELYKGIVLSPNFCIELPIAWWNKYTPSKPQLLPTTIPKNKIKPMVDSRLLSFSPYAIQYSNFFQTPNSNYQEINIFISKNYFAGGITKGTSSINGIIVDSTTKELRHPHYSLGIRYRYYWKKDDNYSGIFTGLSLKVIQAQYEYYYNIDELIYKDEGKGINFEFELGKRYNFSLFTIAPSIGIGYQICDIKNENGEEYLNGVRPNAGLGFGVYLGSLYEKLKND